MLGIIKEQYNEIQDAFAYLGILPRSTKQAFELIKAMREHNHNLLKRTKVHILKFYKLKKKQEAITKAIQVAEILKIATEASPAIDQLFLTNNYHTAIEIIENTEQLIAERLTSIHIAQYSSLHS